MQGDDSRVLTKTTVRLFWRKWRVVRLWRKHLHVRVGFLSTLLKWGVFLSYSWIIRGSERRVATASKKDREKREESPFSVVTPICSFFPCLLFPSFHCFCCLGSSIDRKFSEPSRYVFIAHNEHVGLFWSCVSVFSRLLTCVTLIFYYQKSSLFF